MSADMSNEGARGEVRDALKNIGKRTESLLESGKGLLNALGYYSDRSEDVGSVEEFLEDYRADAKLTEKQRGLFKSWHNVEIIFQLTDTEINQVVNKQLNLPIIKGFDAGISKSFLFLAVELDDRSYNRTELANMTRATNRLFEMPTIVLLRNGNRFTLSTIHRRPRKGDNERVVLEKVTLIKDVNTINTHRAHIDIFAEIGMENIIHDVRNFDGLHKKWEAILNTEELNRRFYEELYKWFVWARDICSFPDDEAGDGSQERHIIRLITRLLFVWFMKEKKLIPNVLFDEDYAREALLNYDPDGSEYYCAILQNLFFATLNIEIEKRGFSKSSKDVARNLSKYHYKKLLRQPKDFIGLLESVPFVNGGLFDCLDSFKDNGKVKYIDVFTYNDEERQKLKVPAKIFFDRDRGIFRLFGHYKFTIEENTPLDQDIALDPELLGQIFEKLLATYNPHTQKTERKGTGSYYTPRYVVDYMVNEALLASLGRNSCAVDMDLEIWCGRLRNLFDQEFDYERAVEGDQKLFDDDEKHAIVRAISELRALDPAVGTGAFPMGILHKLTMVLRRLDPDNTMWQNLQREIAIKKAKEVFDHSDKEVRRIELEEINNTFEMYRTSDFGRKLYLIQNGIFGVDIQPIACQIAKLRFFISLIIEQDADKTKDNFGIKPLPNLETRFIAANTLVGLNKRQGSMVSNKARDIQIEIQELRARHFGVRSSDEKLEIERREARLRRSLRNELEGSGFSSEDAGHVSYWNPYDQNSSVNWFDPEWMFGISHGFEITIGNPPYIRADFPDDNYQGIRSTVMGSGHYETLWKKWDIYIAFIEKSYKLLNDNGMSSLIISNAFCSEEYALRSREYLLKNSCINRIDFFDKIKLFEAGVENISYLIQKVDGSNNIPKRRLHKDLFGNIEELGSDRQKKLTERAFSLRNTPSIDLSSTVRLDEIFYISVGMVVNSDDKKAQGLFTMEDVLSNTRDSLHPKPFMEGKHLKRWMSENNRWLEWGTERAPELYRRKNFPEMYKVNEKLIAGRILGKNARIKVIFDDRQLYHNESAVSFILWRDLKGVMNRSISKEARYPGQSLRNKYKHREELEVNSQRFSIYYLLGVMNSSIFEKILRDDKRSNLSVYPNDWKRLPIPDTSCKKQKLIADVVGEILIIKRSNIDADVEDLEKTVDVLVAELYGFGEHA